MPYLLALASAFFYGAADFLGGLGSRRASALAIVLTTQFAGLAVLAVLVPILPGDTSATADLAWAVTAGLCGSVGVALLYRALAIGRMALVAPTTAVCAVAVPVAVGVVLGERLDARTALGIGVAAVAIVLVSQQRGDAAEAERDRRDRGLPPGLALAVLSGIAIGLFYLSLARTGADAGLWPLLIGRAVSVVLFAGLALASRVAMAMPRQVLTIAVGAGVLDVLANALYLMAARQGPLTAVVTLSSLYPASTVVLARVVLHERLTGLQAAGVVAALAAVALIVG